MHIHYFDPYQPRQSPIHNLDARVKLVLTLGFIITTAIIPPGAWPIYILLLSIIVSIELISSIGIGYVFKRSILALPFVLAALPVLFTFPGQTLASVEWGPIHLNLSQAGLERFFSIGMKSWLSLQAAVVWTASTPFPDLLGSLRAIRIPRLLVAMVGLMWRYLFVLGDEALRLMRARSSRSGESGEPGRRTGGSLSWRARVTGGMAGALFLRSLERSDRIYAAMLSRGYDGETRYLPAEKITAKQWTTLGLGLVLLLFLITLAIWFEY
jgi:cobalt/nickel transport system permease protein